MLYVLYSIYAEKENEILMIEGSRFRVQGSGFKVQGSGFRWRLRRILDDGILPERFTYMFCSQYAGHGVPTFPNNGFGVQGSGFGVQG